MRIITDLNQPAIDALKWICENYKISRAEAIRRAVMEKAEAEMEVAEGKQRKKDEALKANFGIWRNRKTSTMDYLDNLRGIIREEIRYESAA